MLIALSVLLLGRSFYILYVQKRGNRVTEVITWLALLFVVGYWYTGLMSLLQGRFAGLSVAAEAHTKPFPVGV